MRPTPPTKTIYTSLPIAFCCVPHCGRPQRRARCGLCQKCNRLFSKTRIAMAGFIPVTTLTKLAKVIIRESGIAQSDITEALKIARGTRHRAGPWDQRPPWRMTPLLTGTPAKRRPQLLVGRRHEPKFTDVVKALIHHVILEEVLETGPMYARVLAGMTFFTTRGLYCAPGVKPETGQAKHAIYRVNNKDFGLVGTIAIRTCRAAGLDIFDRDLRARIVNVYLTGREDGTYRPAQYPPLNSIRSAKVGDHPFDFLLPAKPWVPPEIRNKTYRAGGTIRGKPVELLAMPPFIGWRHLHPEYRVKRKPQVLERNLRDEPSDTSWIFANRRGENTQSK